MMHNNDHWDLFLDDTLSNAVKEYKRSDTYAAYRDRLDTMDQDCISMLTKDLYAFVEQCFELIMDANGSEERYAYRKGMRDCVRILKELEVLA